MSRRRASALSSLVATLVLALACFALVSLTRPPAALAQSPADVAAARDLFIEGSELSKQERWDEARDRFSRSLALKRAAITMYSLAVAQMRSGQLVEALVSFRAFLAEPIQPATEPYQQAARDAVAELEGRVGYVAVSVSPAGVAGLTVTVDQELIPPAALSLPRMVNPGEHTVSAKAPGYVDAVETLTVTEGQRRELKLVLKNGAVAGPAPGPVGSPDEPAPPPPGDAGPGGSFPVLPVALMVGGGVAFGVGLTVGLLGVSEAADAPTRDGPEADSARTKSIVGDVVAGVGIVAAGVGLVLLLVDGEDDPATDDPTAPAASLRPWSSGPLGGIEIRF